MKKIKIILFTLFGFILVTNCDRDFEELNTDPNNPVAVPAHLLLGTTQRNLIDNLYRVLGGAGGDMGACWAQQWSKVQYNDEERYVPRRGVINGIYNVNNRSILAEAEAMLNLATTEENTNLQAIALIMKATTFQIQTELFGPIPFTEALDPTNLKPAFDDEATVFAGVIDMYTQAANMLASGTGEITASSDLFYGGDSTKWLKLANSLKFRALMRISSTRDVSGELQALINGGQMFSSNADNAQLAYLTAPDDANPIFQTIVNSNRAEYKVCSVLVEKMQALGDNRLPVYAAENADGIILGKPSGYGNQTTLPNEALGYTYANISPIGEFYLNPELPGILMSYAQLSFLKAEAANENLISGGTPQALTYYNEGITASFEFNGVSAVAYIPTVGFSSQNDARTKIGEQQWLALFGQGFEAWTEWRRTGLPALTPAIEGDINEIPSRYYYPTTSPSLNRENYEAAAASIGGDELTSPLFWQ